MWLERLSEQDRKKEQAAARARYEAHYDKEAHLLTAKMRELGCDLSAPAPTRGPSIQEKEAAQLGDVPTLAGESQAAARGRVQYQELRDLMEGGPTRESLKRSDARAPSNGRGGPSPGGGYGR